MRSQWRRLDKPARRLAALGLAGSITILVTWAPMISPDSFFGEYAMAALSSTLICLVALIGGVLTAMFVVHRNSAASMRLIQSLTLTCVAGLVTIFCTVSRFDGNAILIDRATGDVRVPSGFAIYNPLEFRPSVFMPITVMDTEVGYAVTVDPRMTPKELQARFGSPEACTQAYTTIIRNAATDVASIPSLIQRLCIIEGRLTSLLPDCKVKVHAAYTG